MKVPVIYTMGKVGSMAIEAAIKRAGLPCHEIHTLDDAALMRMAKSAIEAGRFPPRHVCTAMAWKAEELSRPDRCLYISPVREPIERNLSAYFHNLPANLATGEPSELLARFVAGYSHRVPVIWFDREFGAQLGIDVYSEPFDHAAKWSRVGNVLLIRSDADDKTKSAVLSKALGKKIEVRRSNVAANKRYADLYRRVLGIARFDGPFLDRMYETRFARHFWSEAELADYRARWAA